MKMAIHCTWVLLIAGLFFTVPLGECASTLAKTTISVSEYSRISSSPIRLGAIADIQGDDQQVVEKLKDVKLGKAPDPGEVKEISGHSIETKIRHSGIDSETVTLNIPEKIEVITEGVKISPEKIEQMVTAFILKRVPWDQQSVTVKMSPVEGITLAQGTVTHEITARKKEDFLGAVNISVVFLVDGKVTKQFQVNARVDVMREVVITNRSLERHDVITPEDVRLEKMNLAELQGNVITDPDEVIGKRTKRTLEVNIPLRLNFLEVTPLVKRGDMVTIVAESDALKITTKGFVKEDGCQGEMVRVINVNSRKELFAKVRDARTVEVDF